MVRWSDTVTAEPLAEPARDLDALAAFAKGVDVVTLEFENIPVTALEAAAIYAPVRADVHVVPYRVAEGAKYLANVFHAVKLAFANEAGAILAAHGVDARESFRIFCEDRVLNISPAYLRPGFAFGGSCLPKDMRSFLALADEAHVPAPFLQHVLPSNEANIERTFEAIAKHGRQRVSLFGLAFKSGTDDLRESPILELVERLLGKGHASAREPLAEQLRAGAVGFKIHEDWGATCDVIDTCLRVCGEYDVQCTIHTDSLNECGFVEDTLRAIDGRTIHTYHTEGAGGGHAPDIIKACGFPNVLPSSTNPTRPFTRNTIDEHLDMLMVCHHLDPSIAEDVAFAESRIRRETIAAEDILHEIGRSVV